MELVFRLVDRPLLHATVTDKISEKNARMFIDKLGSDSRLVPLGKVLSVYLLDLIGFIDHAVN